MSSDGPVGAIEQGLVAEGAWYAVVEVGQQALAMLTIPVLLFLLTAEDFGVITWGLVTAQVAMTFGSVGLDFSVLRLYFRWPQSERGSLTAGVGVLVSGWCTALGLIAWPAAASIDERIRAPMLLGCWAGLLLAVRAVPLAVIRVRGEVKKYLAIVLGGAVLQAVVQLLLVWRGFGPTGYMAGYAFGSAIGLAGAVAVTGLAFDWSNPAWRLTSETRRFTRRIFPSALFNRLLAVADRLALGASAPLESLGLYGVATRFTTPIKFLSSSFKMALVPAMSRSEARGGLDVVFARLGRFIVLIMLLAGALTVLIVWFVRFTPWATQSLEIQQLVALLLAAQLLAGIALLGQVRLYYSNVPHAAAVVVAAHAAVLLVGLAVLVPRAGGMGAAAAEILAAAAGVCVFSALILWQTRQLVPWAELLLWTCTFLPCALASWVLGPELQLAVVGLTVAAYGGLVFALGRRATRVFELG